MRLLTILFSFSCSLLSPASLLLAQGDGPALTISQQQAGRTLRLVVSSDQVGESCSYSLFTSRSRRKLKGTSPNLTAIATSPAEATVTELLAENLTRIRSSRNGARRANVYFVVIRNCNEELASSTIKRIRVRASSRAKAGKKFPRWRTLLSEAIKANQVEFAEAFSSLSFDQPVDLETAPDGTNRIFVVELGGVIRVFENNPDISASSVFLDISDKVVSGGERGLFSIAFHPNYSSNGYFYLHYTEADDGDTVIARYKVSDGDPNVADSSSELILLTTIQPFSNHNGGEIAFGPDELLYIALGDGGSSGDPMENGEDRTTLLGNILRIDVDNPSGGNNYGIPSNNPFVNNDSGFFEEIFAYGFRNPWRVSFDSVTGELYVADVGQDSREEIDIVESGKNYGWNTMEGKLCFDPKKGCSKSGREKPLHDYDHSLGASITGGYVYRGSAVEPLSGKYVFADFITGRIWMLLRSGKKPIVTELANTELLISSFGVDQDNELYFLTFSEGKVYRFSS